MAESVATSRPMGFGRFAAYVGIVCGIVAIFVLSWLLRDILLVAFGVIVVAVAIRTIVHPLRHRLGLRENWAVALVVVSVIFGGLALSWLFGYEIAQQLQGLWERLPRAFAEIRTSIEQRPAGNFIIERMSGFADGSGGGSLDGLQKFAVLSVSTVGHAVLMFFGGVFVAANPTLYLNGFVRLFPTSYRPQLRAALVESGGALRKWLLGQLVSMTCVGTLTGVGLWIVGAPLALVLGIIAGLLNFIPILGPIIAIGPGVLVALTDGPKTALYAAIVYIVVQELEGHAITPLAQRWAVKLPPAYGLIAVLTFAALFGLFGVLFGIPLAVVVMFLVRNLYIEHGLEKDPVPARRRGVSDVAAPS